MEGIKLNSISVLEAKKKLDAEYTESIDLNQWVNLGTGSLSFVESGTQVIDVVVSGIKPKPLTLEVEVITRKRGRKTRVSKARIKRASVRGKLLMLSIFGKEYGKVVRLKRKVYKGKFSPPGTYTVMVDGVEFSGCQMVFDVYSRIAHPRCALIITKSGITPVRIKGK